jgi:hypothetical protein
VLFVRFTSEGTNQAQAVERLKRSLNEVCVGRSDLAAELLHVAGKASDQRMQGAAMDQVPSCMAVSHRASSMRSKITFMRWVIALVMSRNVFCPSDATPWPMFRLSLRPR